MHYKLLTHGTFNPLKTGDTLLCGWSFEPAKYTIINVVPIKHVLQGILRQS